MAVFNDIRDEKNIYPQGDHLVRAAAFDSKVRAMAIDLTEAVKMQQEALGLNLLTASLVAETMMGAAFLGADLKNDDARLSVTIMGDSSGKRISAFCDAKLRLKATIDDKKFMSDLLGDSLDEKQSQELENILSDGSADLAKIIGKGRIQVIKNLKDGKPYTGLVDTLNGDVAQSFVYYLALSEQRHGVMMFGLNYKQGKISKVTGLFAELLPFAEESVIAKLEARVASFPKLSDLSADFMPAQIIDLLMGDPEIKYLSVDVPKFYCNCSKDYFAEKLMTLGRADLEHLAEDPKGIEIRCDYCGSKYKYSNEEVLGLIK